MLSNRTVTRTPLANVLPPNLFVLNLDRAASLVSSNRFPITFDRKLILLVLLLSSVFASAIVSLKGANELLTMIRLTSIGVMTQGQIVSHAPVMARADTQGTQGLMYPVIYHFSLPNSATIYDGEQLVQKEMLDVLAAGAAVTVRYLPGDPTISTLVGINLESPLGASGLAFVAIGATWLFATGVFLVPLLQRIRGEVQLRRLGWVTFGQILYCRVQRPSEAGEKKPAQDFVVELSYRFQTPQGKEIRSTASAKRKDLKGTRLPGFGTPVAVLYLDPQHYEVL
jgi:hypothetical protein